MNISWIRSNLKKSFLNKSANREPLVLDANDMIASVAINLYLDKNNNFKILLIKRSERDDDPWSGHMALPGGGVEKKDEDVYHTVKRENQEEVGFSPLDECFIGRLDPYIPRYAGKKNRLIIHPFIFLLEKAPIIDPCEDEVQNIYWVELNEFFRPNNFSSCKFNIKNNDIPLPAFTTIVDEEKIVVWGVTYVILLNFLYILKDVEGIKDFLPRDVCLNSMVEKWVFYPYK